MKVKVNAQPTLDLAFEEPKNVCPECGGTRPAFDLQHSKCCRVCDVVRWAKDILASEFYVLDVESTGVDKDAEIIQIGVIDAQGETVLGTVIKPQKAIDEKGSAFRTNGITNAMVESAPTFRQVYPLLFELIAGKDILTYNAQFDNGRIGKECAFYGLPYINASWHCVMLKVAQFRGIPGKRGDFEWCKLGRACELFHVEPDGAYEAVSDCRSTLELLKAIAAYDVRT